MTRGSKPCGAVRAVSSDIAFRTPANTREALAELDHRVVREGMVGVKLYNQYMIDDPVVLPFIERSIEPAWRLGIHTLWEIWGDGAGASRKPGAYRRGLAACCQRHQLAVAENDAGQRPFHAGHAPADAFRPTRCWFRPGHTPAVASGTRWKSTAIVSTGCRAKPVIAGTSRNSRASKTLPPECPRAWSCLAGG